MNLTMLKILAFFLVVSEFAEGCTKYDASDRLSATLQNGVTPKWNRYNMGKLLHLSTGERLSSVEMVKTAQGRYKKKMKETYLGYDVIGFGVEADMDPHSGYTGIVSGEIIIGIESDIKNRTSCIQSNETILEVALMDSGLSSKDISVSEEKCKRKIYLKNDHDAVWVYEVEFLYVTETAVSRPFYIIDACDLTIFMKFDRVNNMTSNMNNFLRALEAQENCDPKTTTTSPPTTTTTPPTTPTSPTTTPTPPTPKPVPDKDCDESSKTTTSPPEVKCTSPAKGVGGNLKTGKYNYGVPPRCINPTVKRNLCILETEHVKVIDLKQSRTRSNRSPAANFTCSKGYSDEINGAFSPVMDAFYFGYTTVQAIKEWYKINPLGFKPIMYVHYGKQYENAFWDGKSLTFGDGKNFFYPLVSLDVVAHELGHGITTRFSNLFYSGQSGGINEAFSDITGELVEAYALSNDWYVGFELRKDPKKALRYFEDPTKDGRSIKHITKYRSGLNVHHSSGLFNHAFYQLVQIQNMPMKEAYHCFIQANQIYWKERSNFEEGACGVLRSAHDLGYNSYLTEIKAAFAVVGIKMEKCQEDTFMETLKDGTTIRRLIVSAEQNPMFLLDPPTTKTSVTIKAISVYRKPINIELGTEMDGPYVASSQNTLKYDLSDSSSPLYLRFSADEYNSRVYMSIRYT